MQASASDLVKAPQFSVPSGIQEIEADQTAVIGLIDKVIEKIVRVTVSDGRVYLGRLMSVD